MTHRLLRLACLLFAAHPVVSAAADEPRVALGAVRRVVDADAEQPCRVRDGRGEHRTVEREARERQDQQVTILLLPKDEADERNAILEVRAGTGGEEASLFAGELLRAYTRFAEKRGWKHELLSLSHSDLGGVREAVLLIEGEGASALLRHEAGVHRVQRVQIGRAHGLNSSHT